MTRYTHSNEWQNVAGKQKLRWMCNERGGTISHVNAFYRLFFRFLLFFPWLKCAPMHTQTHAATALSFVYGIATSRSFIKTGKIVTHMYGCPAVATAHTLAHAHRTRILCSSQSLRHSIYFFVNLRMVYLSCCCCCCYAFILQKRRH